MSAPIECPAQMLYCRHGPGHPSMECKLHGAWDKRNLSNCTLICNLTVVGCRCFFNVCPLDEAEYWKFIIKSMMEMELHLINGNISYTHLHNFFTPLRASQLCRGAISKQQISGAMLDEQVEDLLFIKFWMNYKMIIIWDWKLNSFRLNFLKFYILVNNISKFLFLLNMILGRIFILAVKILIPLE